MKAAKTSPKGDGTFFDYPSDPVAIDYSLFLNDTRIEFLESVRFLELLWTRTSPII